ncbi:copper resistance CopC family protein [Microbacterium oleivorans]|uniref:Copper resistance protein CopC n=1 Tax=Microbacterium oleivorans TaxID=273677 RepID=A0A031FX32_9MICO|nr:copper resistance CopC family protein [Microbacterium oleivorans]EZP29434.1 Copper resistance protein CopC precursor [Microbacterium oleivorans]THE08793.1 copper resistance protein CopC [Microbacterium oleivorans]
MSSTTRRASRLSGAIAGAAVAALLLLSPTATAAAHDALLASDPAPDDVLGTTPDKITLTFSDAASTEPGATEFAAFDEECSPLASGEPVVDGNTVTQAISGPVEGAVLVQWKVVSSDGHPISDEYTFSVGEEGKVAAVEQCGESLAEQAEGSSEGFNAVPYAVGGALIFTAVGVVIAVAIVRGRRGATKE